LASGDPSQYIRRAVPDSCVVHFDPHRIVCLDDVPCVYEGQPVAVDELPVGPSGQNATGNRGAAGGSTGDGHSAPEPQAAVPQFEHRTDVDAQFECELEVRGYS
jgi:hypothetical protein